MKRASVQSMEESFIEDDGEENYESKRAAIKHKTKSFWASSRGRILVVWTLTFTLIAAIYFMMPSDDPRTLESIFLFSSLLGKFNWL